MSVREGVIWLSLATVAELLPVVRQRVPVYTSLHYPHPSLFCVVGVPLFGPEW
jgi:hypothetical protein